jgi:hypothetical protein
MRAKENEMTVQDDADWRADELTDKLVGWLVCRPEKATRQEVLTAMHEWLKSQLAMLGVATSVDTNMTRDQLKSALHRFKNEGGFVYESQIKDAEELLGALEAHVLFLVRGELKRLVQGSREDCTRRGGHVWTADDE